MGTTAEKLAYLAETKQQIKTAIENKGVSIPDGTTFRQYAEKVGEISGGGIPNYIAPKNNVNGVYQADNTATSFSLNGATSVDGYALCRAFYNCSNLKSIDLSSLVTIDRDYSMYYGFYRTGLEGTLDLSNLESITGGYSLCYSFQDCKIQYVNLSKLKKITGTIALNSTFYGNEQLTSVDLSSLEEITSRNAMASCFIGCISLKELRFPAIKTTTFGTSNKNQFSNMCSGCTDIVLHFPSNVESVIRGLTGYSDTQPFDAISGQVLFDLNPTE